MQGGGAEGVAEPEVYGVGGVGEGGGGEGDGGGDVSGKGEVFRAEVVVFCCMYSTGVWVRMCAFDLTGL